MTSMALQGTVQQAQQAAHAKCVATFLSTWSYFRAFEPPYVPHVGFVCKLLRGCACSAESC